MDAHVEKSDEEIVALSLKEPEVFGVLMERYEKKLFFFVRRICSLSAAEVEDLLQEIFIKCYRYLNDFDQDLKFSSWIYRIARNETISYIRKIKARPQTIPEEDGGELLRAIAADWDLEEEVRKKLDGEKVRELLSQLDRKYREILVLRYLEDKSYEEIADIVKKPEGTVATLINRAKKKFKKILEANKLSL